MSNGGKSSKRPRVFFAIVYFVIALFLFYFFKEKIFYLDLESSSYHFYRFIWCVGASFIGFSVLLFKIIDSKSSVFPSYITYYPVMLCAQAALVFSFIHLFPKCSGFLFYYLSFSSCFILALFVDNFWNIINSIINKLSIE